MKQILASIFLLSAININTAAAVNWYMTPTDFGLAPGAAQLNGGCWGIASGVTSKPTSIYAIDGWSYKYVQCDASTIMLDEYNYNVTNNPMIYLLDPSRTIPADKKCTANTNGAYNCVQEYNGERYACVDGTVGNACDYCVEFPDKVSIDTWQTDGDRVKRYIQKYVAIGNMCTRETTIEYGCPAGTFNSGTASSVSCKACPSNATCTQTVGHTDSYKCNAGYYKGYQACYECPRVDVWTDGAILANPNISGVNSCYLRNDGDYGDEKGRFTILDNDCYYYDPE